MFVCDDCHKDHVNAFMCGMMRSLGKCESCDEVRACNDCHYRSPEAEAEVARLVAELNDQEDEDDKVS